ncbi:ABC transporter permease [Horticoccus sp. 23ND18S-11]|uniref:ABC transporter permease n=1 Tax=Horticoccus sp. 23ND18S-11 TaxID=3391832 RepID=UPI0039C9ED39
MSPNLRIAYRFLTAKKRAMFMSLSCTVLGVGLFIVTQATTSGFERFFIKVILGINGAIRIDDKIQDTQRSMAAAGASDSYFAQEEGVKYIEGVEEPARIMEALREFENVRGISAVVNGVVQITSSFKTENSPQVFGINLEDHLQVSDLGEQITSGSLDTFRETRNGVLMGRVLADRLQIGRGDSIVIAVRGQSRRFRVAAIYETGYRDVDKTNVYLHMSEARSLLKKPTGATFLQIGLHNPDRAPEDAKRMVEILRHKATSWQEREVTWLAVFKALRVSTAITVTVFTLIASLAMFNTLAMIVLEKTKDIAILRSMGYERQDITRIFLWQAGIVLAIGAAIGALFGWAVTWLVEQVPLPINGIFKTDHFIVVRDPNHYFAAVATAVVMVMIASLIPARRAARLEPGDIVRGTAQ